MRLRGGTGSKNGKNMHNEYCEKRRRKEEKEDTGESAKVQESVTETEPVRPLLCRVSVRNSSECSRSRLSNFRLRLQE